MYSRNNMTKSIFLLVGIFTVTFTIIGGGKLGKNNKQSDMSIEDQILHDEKSLLKIIKFFQTKEILSHKSIDIFEKLHKKAEAIISKKTLPKKTLNKVLIAICDSKIYDEGALHTMDRYFYPAAYLKSVITLLINAGADIYCDDNSPLIYAAYHDFHIFSHVLECSARLKKSYRLSVFRTISLDHCCCAEVKQLVLKKISELTTPQVPACIPVQLEFVAKQCGVTLNRESLQRVMARLDINRGVILDNLIGAVMAEFFPGQAEQQDMNDPIEYYI